MTDVLYIKVREYHKVKSKAVHIAIGVDSKGFKSVIGFMISDSESEQTWALFYNSMIARGLTNVQMVISDAHQGRVNAIQKCFTNSVWQRYQVHFLRNVLDRLPKKNTELVRSEIKDLFRVYNIDVARETKDQLIEKYQYKYEKMCEVLDSGFEDAFQFTACLSTRYNRLKAQTFWKD